LIIPVSPSDRSRAAWVVPAATLLASLVLAITGLGAWLAVGRMSGWMLLIHMLAAPLFSIGLTLTALAGAERHRPGRGGECIGPDTAGTPARAGALQQLLFWLMLALGFGVMASILAAMLPLFGYADQTIAYAIHRYGAIGFVGVALAYVGVRRLPTRSK
jgi:hypothetical protein